MSIRTNILACVACGFAPILAAATEPIRIVPAGTVENPRQPHAAVDEDGAIYVVYGSGDGVYCSISLDGTHFGPPHKVGEVDRLHLGKRRGPRIAASAEAIVVTAIGRAGDVLAWRSTDRGKTWHGPVRVNDDAPGKALEALHALAMGPGGEVFTVWLDLRNGSNEIYGAGSADGGKTWSASRLVYRSPDGTVCECCHPAVTYDAEGGLYVMWRNWLDGNRDLYMAFSSDGGKTFGPAEKLGTGSWRLNACPMDGGYLAVTSPGQVTTAWRRQGNVYRTDPGTEREQLLGPGEQPWVAATREAAYVVWLDRPENDLWLATPHAQTSQKLADAASDPMIAAPIAGTGPVVAVWEAAESDATTIMATIID